MPRIETTIEDLEWIADTIVTRLKRELKWAKNLQEGPLRPMDRVVVSGGDVSNPTQRDAISKPHQRLRRAVSEAQRDVLKALITLERAGNQLDAVFRSVDPSYERVDNRYRPSRVTTAEVNQAKAYQRKRELAGGGFGAS